jgi:aerobic carbon-monoxide dehydrogenase small subunit
MIEPQAAPAAAPEDIHEVALTVNGRHHTRQVPARTLLSDFIRHELGLHGTHVGCEHGVCGACTVLVDGVTSRSCLMFAVQASGSEVMTIEGLAEPNNLHPIQQAFWEEHGLQCGFCTPGIVLSLVEYLRDNPGPRDADELRTALAGTLCRCTGYVHIVNAGVRASQMLSKSSEAER